MRSREQAKTAFDRFEAELAACVQAGFERFAKDAAELRTVLQNGSQSHVLRDCIVFEIKARFEGRPGFNVWSRGQTFLLSYQGEYLIRIKKLSPRSLRASYGRTIQAQAWVDQRQIELPHLPDPATHLHLGYALNAMRSSMQGIYLVCPDGSRLHWHWQLSPGVAQQASAGTVVPLPNAGSGSDAPQRVRIRQTQDGDAAADDTSAKRT